MAVLISSHQINEIEALYSHIGILHEGRLIEQAGKDALVALDIELEDFYMNVVNNFRKGQKSDSLNTLTRRRVG